VLDPWTIGGLFLGGVIAAPIAAWLVTRIPAPVLGTAVGGIIVFTNARTVLRALDLPGPATAAIYVLILAAWATAVTVALRKLRATAAATERELVATT
jgi:hypothetical protein